MGVGASLALIKMDFIRVPGKVFFFWLGLIFQLFRFLEGI